MYPLLPFAAGLLAGAVVTRLVKADRARASLDRAQDRAWTSLGKAQDRLREATVSSLAAIEHTSAGLRAKLTHEGEEASGAEAAGTRAEARASATTAGPDTSDDAMPTPRARRRAAPKAPTAAKPATRTRRAAKTEKAEKSDKESL